jgi:hypothetical protein
MWTDVVFGLVILRTSLLFPQPEGERGFASLREFFQTGSAPIAMILIAIVLVTIYWIQNNAILGRLSRTDGRHTTIAILHLFSLLLFLYAVRLGLEFDGDLEAMVSESGAAALMGLLGVVGCIDASRRGLVDPRVSEGDAKRLFTKLLPEPLTALLTIPLAFVGPRAWGLAWLVLGVGIGYVLRRRLRDRDA